MIALYILGYFCRNKQNSYAALSPRLSELKGGPNVILITHLFAKSFAIVVRANRTPKNCFFQFLPKNKFVFSQSKFLTDVHYKV